MRTVTSHAHQEPDVSPARRPAAQPVGLLRLQRLAGNSAVTALLAGPRTSPALAVQRCGSTPADSCACHGNDDAGHGGAAMAQPYTGPETSDPV